MISSGVRKNPMTENNENRREWIMLKWSWKIVSKGPRIGIQLVNNLKLRTKLLLAFASVLVLSAISIGTYHDANLSNTKTYQSLIEVQQAILGHSASAKLSLLQSLVHEKNFIFQKNREEGQRVKENLALLKQNIQAIKDIRRKAGAPEEAIEEMSRVMARIDKYEKILEEVIATLNNNGFDTSKVERQVKELGSAAKNIDKRVSEIQEAATWNMERKLEQAAVNTRSKARVALIVGAVSFLLSILLAILFAWRMNKILFRVIVFAGNMSKGDFTRSLDMKRKDEFGLLANALNQMGSDLGHMIRQMTGKVVILTGSSSDLSFISEEMSQTAAQTAGKADNVAVAAEEMSSSMNSVSETSDQASSNLIQVSAATEEMSVTVGEIAQNAERANLVVMDMIEKIKSTSAQLDDLGAAAQAITSITDTITGISKQTNLLALNATIEAARAGAAGKGFAVVATEIKELANQTSASTQDIKHRIDGIKTSTQATVAEITQMTGVVEDVSQIVREIAASVSQQAQTTNQIAANINQVSDRIHDVNENIANSSTVAHEIAQDVVEVNKSAEKMSSVSSQVNTSAEQLSKLAWDLEVLAGAFKVTEG